jgi:uncharacterized protein
MAQLLRQGHAAADVMDTIAQLDAKRGPYAPCPCGSGKKFRFCHGNNTPSTVFSDVAPSDVAAHAQAIPNADSAPVSRVIPSVTTSGID